MEKNLKKNVCKCIIVSLFCTAEIKYNIVNQLYLSKKKFFRKKSEREDEKKKKKNKYLKRLCLEFSKIIDKYQTSITRSSKTPNRLLKKKLTQNDFG